jgi:hypothetical protein
MIPNDNPLYVSSPSKKSLGNEYRIFPNRIELKSRLFFSTFVIPRREIVSIDVFRPPVIRTAFWALKLDLADLFEHVGLVREKGWFKQLRFTPQNPQEFVMMAQKGLRL